MNQPQVSIFPAEMTTALYRRAIASAWRQKTLNETGSDQYGPHSLTVERIEMAIALHIECALINEYGEAQGAAAALALLTDMLEPSLLTAPPVLTVRGCEVMAELYRTLPAAFDDFFAARVWRCIRGKYDNTDGYADFSRSPGEMARYSADAAY